MRILHTFRSEGFVAEAVEFPDGRVEIDGADADIDADGANGQNGRPAAYMLGNVGTEHLANGGLAMSQCRAVIAHTWAKDIFILDQDGQPKVFAGGILASKTAYHFPGLNLNNPAAHVDSETVPYIVVSPILVNAVRGVVLGCQARATNLETGKAVTCVVADVGPRNKIGEVSIEAARSLGIRSSPRNGGTDRAVVKYEFWPDRPASIAGVTFRLQRANGTHI